MNNCLVVLNSQHVIQNKIEMKYKMKQQLPGCIIYSTRHSSKIEIKYKIKAQLPVGIKHTQSYSNVIK